MSYYLAKLDSAFLRRFQKRVLLPLPDLNARMDFIARRVKQGIECAQLSPQDVQLIAEKTEGYDSMITVDRVGAG